MKIILKVAIKHPIHFVKGIVGGICQTVKNYRDPNYTRMTPEAAEAAWNTNIEKLKKFT